MARWRQTINLVLCLWAFDCGLLQAQQSSIDDILGTWVERGGEVLEFQPNGDAHVSSKGSARYRENFDQNANLLVSGAGFDCSYRAVFSGLSNSRYSIMTIQLISKRGNCPPDGEYRRAAAASGAASQSPQILNSILREERMGRFVFGQKLDTGQTVGTRTAVDVALLRGTFAKFQFSAMERAAADAYVDESTGLLKAVNIHGDTSYGTVLKPLFERIAVKLGNGLVQYVSSTQSTEKTQPTSLGSLQYYVRKTTNTVLTSVVQRAGPVRLLYTLDTTTFDCVKFCAIDGPIRSVIPLNPHPVENIWFVAD